MGDHHFGAAPGFNNNRRFLQVIGAGQKLRFNNIQFKLVHHGCDLFFTGNIAELVVLGYRIDMTDKTLHIDRQAPVIPGFQTFHKGHVKFGI